MLHGTTHGDVFVTRNLADPFPLSTTNGQHVSTWVFFAGSVMRHYCCLL